MNIFVTENVIKGGLPTAAAVGYLEFAIREKMPPMPILTA